MELNGSTFVLEIINFLVLVWILKRFLYKPVLGVIARRRAGIEKSLADARTLHDDAEALQVQYQDRLRDWERERQHAREQLAGEIEKERARRRVALQSELAQEKEKAQVAEQRRRADAAHKTEETALIQAARFATRLLEQAAGPELEARLVTLALDELSQLTDERRSALRNSWGRDRQTVVVTSAYPLPEPQRRTLERAIAELAGSDKALRFEQDQTLLAGVRICIGAWMLSVNLQDELKSLAEFSHHAPRG